MRQIRTEGERIVERIKAKTFSLMDGWEKWLSPPEWSVPDLSKGWEEV